MKVEGPGSALPEAVTLDVAEGLGSCCFRSYNYSCSYWADRYCGIVWGETPKDTFERAEIDIRRSTEDIAHTDRVGDTGKAEKREHYRCGHGLGSRNSLQYWTNNPVQRVEACSANKLPVVALAPCLGGPGVLRIGCNEGMSSIEHLESIGIEDMG